MRGQSVGAFIERAVGQAALRRKIDQRGLVAADLRVMGDPVEIGETHYWFPRPCSSFAVASGRTIQTGGTAEVNLKSQQRASLPVLTRQSIFLHKMHSREAGWMRRPPPRRSGFGPAGGSS